MYASIVIVVYLLLLLLGSFRKESNNSEPDHYLLAGRKLTLLPFVATMVTTAYGWILGIGQVYYTYGISAWLFLSLPYTTFSLLMAFFLSKKIRQEQLRSVPELLEKHYGNSVSKLGALAVLLLISPAMYALMSGQIFSDVLKIPVWQAVILSLIFSSIYLFRGGFSRLAKMDKWKFLLMFGGFLLALVYIFLQVGLSPLLALPESKLKLQPVGHVWELITWFLLASLVFVDPSYHQRIYASANDKVARVGLIISVFFWTLFDFLAASLALYACGLFPELENPALAYTTLGLHFLPDWLGPLFILGLLAGVMSTLDSFLFLSSQTLMLDLLGLKNRTKRSMQWGLVIVSLLTFLILLPYMHSSAVDFFFDFTPFIVCTLVLPVISIFIPSVKISRGAVGWQIIGALAVCLLWTLFPNILHEELNAVIPGLAFAVLFQVFWLIIHKRANRIRE